MIIGINTKEGEDTFETNNIDDINTKNKVHIIIQKVANLEIINEALLLQDKPIEQLWRSY